MPLYFYKETCTKIDCTFFEVLKNGGLYRIIYR